MDRPEPNNGQPYQQQYRGGYEIPSVRVRHAIRAAQQREQRWSWLDRIVTRVVNGVRVPVRGNCVVQEDGTPLMRLD